ncbi:adenylyl-sulfate kinase [Leeuwenhoekiella blandensis]|uniref:Adenylyl-sulfate kinase n=1 Tax=Leeuwenhoekiella blandensis (strain CECT 7118 / CCUG 51940 / KCTC 22103 / MED217) TaxID=398720 RepID=A3XR66_LEEBM|nr:adenylyl-sulfate kinase [Leeuwenhoekiella blandensis]EAQ47959.1 adenylylsulfate kinase [Leeuwenhoekiella blandensis MED217]
MKSTNVKKQAFQVARDLRAQKKQHQSMVLWFVGLSGSGKSTVSDALEAFLFEKHIDTYTLDGDNIRMGLNKDLGFTVEERSENIRRIAEVGKLFTDAGTVVLTAFITPMHQDRQRAKAILGEDYVEIYVNCPLEVCEARDVKGLYARARKGEIPNFTGITAPFEVPKNPDIEIKTNEQSVDECVVQIWNTIKNRLTSTL